MDECSRFFDMMGKTRNGKKELLDFLRFMDVHNEQKEVYEVIAEWSDDKCRSFANWWDKDFDTLDIQVYDWEDDYIEKEKALPN